MTYAKAKVIFATHMQAARTRKLTRYEQDQLRRASQVLRQGRRSAMNPRSMKRNRKPTLNEATDYRLQEIRDAFESGVSRQTGQVIRAGGDPYGEVVGRVRGVKSSFPELAILEKDSPATIAAAIRKGKGKTYERVRWAVARGFERTGDFEPVRIRPAGRATIEPHEGRSYCKHCKIKHTRGQHAAHGSGAFHRTHAFAFGSRRNPQRVTRIYGRVLRIEAQKTGKHQCDAECKKCGHRYFHDFRKKPAMYGLPDGSILIKG